jgi:HEAT repeat protein
MGMAWLFVSPALAAEGGASAAGQEEAARLYQQGYALVLEEQWAEGRRVLRNLIDRYADSDWVDDSRFWLCHVEVRERPGSTEAFECFEQFIDAYPRSRYVDDAQTRLVEIGRELVRQGHSEYADKVRDLRESQDEEVALMALRALAEIGDEESLQALLSLYDTDLAEGLRARIVRLLEEFDSPQARARLMEIARADPSLRVRAQAIGSLEDHAWDEQVDSFMREMVRSQQPVEIRRTALRAIGDRADAGWIPLLGDVAATTEDDSVAGAALSALEDIGGAEATAALQAVSESAASASIRRRALAVLAETGGEASIPVLERVALESADRQARRAALAAIGEIGSARALQALSRLASESADPDVRGYALRAMEDIEGDSAVAAVARALREDPEPQVRRQAARTLGELGSAPAVDALRQAALSESDTTVQRAVIDALGEIGTPAAREALLELLKNQ